MCRVFDQTIHRHAQVQHEVGLSTSPLEVHVADDIILYRQGRSGFVQQVSSRSAAPKTESVIFSFTHNNHTRIIFFEAILLRFCNNWARNRVPASCAHTRLCEERTLSFIHCHLFQINISKKNSFDQQKFSFLFPLRSIRFELEFSRP